MLGYFMQTLKKKNDAQLNELFQIFNHCKTCENRPEFVQSVERRNVFRIDYDVDDRELFIDFLYEVCGLSDFPPTVPKYAS